MLTRWRPSLEAGQKWGVYSCPSLTELKSHNNDGSECQSLETTHFWQGQRLRQTCKTNKICARRQGQNARQCTKPSITYDHAKTAVMKQTCDNFKLAYQTTLQCRKDVRELWNSQYVSLGRYNTCAARLASPASNEPYIQYRAWKENKLNRYNTVSNMHDNARMDAKWYAINTKHCINYANEDAT